MVAIRKMLSLRFTIVLSCILERRSQEYTAPLTCSIAEINLELLVFPSYPSELSVVLQACTTRLCSNGAEPQRDKHGRQASS